MEAGKMLGLAIYHAQQFITDPMEKYKPAHLAIANSLTRGYYNEYSMYVRFCMEERIHFVSKNTWDYHVSNPHPEAPRHIHTGALIASSKT